MHKDRGPLQVTSSQPAIFSSEGPGRTSCWLPHTRIHHYCYQLCELGLTEHLRSFIHFSFENSYISKIVHGNYCFFSRKPTFSMKNYFYQRIQNSVLTTSKPVLILIYLRGWTWKVIPQKPSCCGFLRMSVELQQVWFFGTSCIHKALAQGTNGRRHRKTVQIQ